MYSTGTRISVRGEDFLITNVIQSGSHYLIDTEGLSELVKGLPFSFDTALDKSIQAIDPAQTQLRPDKEGGYRLTRLFLETALRHASITTTRIALAHKGGFNPSDYQFEPTLKALRLPRPRLLLADGVGLGKTIEAGILLTELIRRGRGQRIMVLALKSVLGQFQQELWQRFAIPLVRLDSDGLDRIRAELPLNKNPFDYYDKTIVSIDTLKNSAKFRYYIEKSRWDVIVIDECHTVTNSGSLRGDLAQLLATKCESLILASATPHNGRRESFANLIRLIEPTAIPRSGHYEKADVEPYYVRRFKHHIQEATVRANFQERQVERLAAPLYTEEVKWLSQLQNTRFAAYKDHRRTDMLFAVGLFKAYMSSPKAALATVSERLKRLTEKKQIDDLKEISSLQSGLSSIITLRKDAKYDRLRLLLTELGWRGRKESERIVVFAERIDTLNYLQLQLTADFKLSEKSVAVFSGSLSDMVQQAVIEDFGKADSDVRLLLCSDAGSQGVNLHYFCHRMVNYDIPWSLITLEQRNGRIDRYGQKETPYIYYLVAEADPAAEVSTDLRIIENLTRKEEEVYRTLGDAGSVMKLYDSKKEEKAIQEALIQKDESLFEHVEQTVKSLDFEFSDDVFAAIDNTPALELTLQESAIDEPVSFYTNDAAYYRDLTEQLISSGQLKPREAEWSSDTTYLELTNTPDLDRLLYDLPREAKPKVNDCYRLTTDRALVQKSIADARDKRGQWAKFQVLYDLHPIVIPNNWTGRLT